MKVLFCQFSTNFLYSDSVPSIADKYYNQIWEKKEKDGYFKNSDFWELPLWIAESSYILRNEKKELHIIKDLSESIEYIKNSKEDYILFSVLDINKKYVNDIIKALPNKKFIIGGYVDFKAFYKFKNVSILKTINELAVFIGVPYIYGLDYNLFKGFSTIPRLTLSTGCLNVCKFCSVEKTIKEKTIAEIKKQVMSFKHLNFKLVYLNDKTLGQCKNYNLLHSIYYEIKKYNPNFKGFIVQTTCNMLLNKTFVNDLKGLYIFAIELGMETYNNDILNSLRKPQNIKTIDKAINILTELNINIIGNFIIGLIGENKTSYNNTIGFIKRHIGRFYLLNIYNLAVYINTPLNKELKANSAGDTNENNLNKSFYTEQQNIDNKYFHDNIFKLGIEMLGIK